MKPDRSHAATADLRRMRRALRNLRPGTAGFERRRAALLGEIRLAKSQLQGSRRQPAGRRTRVGTTPSGKVAAGERPQAAVPAKPAKRPASLAELLSPKNLQDSLKAVGNLRTMVKNCLQYLQQADAMLDTLYTTSHTLRETGVLEKLVKQRGRNLTTEDFTNILVALMNSPLGSQFLRSMGGDKAAAGDDSNDSAAAGGTAAGTPAGPGPQTPAQVPQAPAGAPAPAPSHQPRSGMSPPGQTPGAQTPPGQTPPGYPPYPFY
ncbi:MAG: hypothetical protein IRZ33_02760 [Alicyclobacillaceae bacterium]|nr:hypothetical protein [Alicyclobacillaceae bacterium]